MPGQEEAPAARHPPQSIPGIVSPGRSMPLIAPTPISFAYRPPIQMIKQRNQNDGGDPQKVTQS